MILREIFPLEWLMDLTSMNTSDRQGFSRILQPMNHIFSVSLIFSPNISKFKLIFSTRKTMEYYFKRTFYGEGISAVPPDEYSERFVTFIDGVVFMKPTKTLRYKEVDSMSGKGDMMEDD